MKNLKNYVSLNLLSISGYIFLALILVFVHTFPESTQYIYKIGQDAPSTMDAAKLVAVGTIFVYTIVELVLLLVFILELLIYKFTKTEPRIINISEKFKKTHLWIFVFGILISVLPMAAFLLYLYFSA